MYLVCNLMMFLKFPVIVYTNLHMMACLRITPKSESQSVDYSPVRNSRRHVKLIQPTNLKNIY